MNIEQLFWDLYRAPVETEVEKILERYSLLNRSGELATLWAEREQLQRG